MRGNHIKTSKQTPREQRRLKLEVFKVRTPQRQPLRSAAIHLQVAEFFGILRVRSVHTGAEADFRREPLLSRSGELSRRAVNYSSKFSYHFPFGVQSIHSSFISTNSCIHAAQYDSGASPRIRKHKEKPSSGTVFQQSIVPAACCRTRTAR